MKNKDYVRLTIGMSSDFKKKLRRVSARHDMTMSEFILKVLTECVKRMEAPNRVGSIPE